MQEQMIATKLGQIAVSVAGERKRVPIVFLHGVFLDKTIWDGYDPELTGKTHIYLDMPAHGNSSDVGRDWALNECVDMLIAVLDALEVRECIAIGHSWGGMTVLRAASRFPSRFMALGLFNMPFKREVGIGRLSFQFQKLLAYFPRFYAAQIAQAMYSKDVLRQRPEIIKNMQDRLARRSPKEIARLIDAVILNSADATPLLEALQVPALAMVGAADKLDKPPGVKTITAPGGHVGPQEAMAETKAAILKVVGLAGAGKRS